MSQAVPEDYRRQTACPKCKRREKVHACARQYLPEQGEELYCDGCGFHWWHPIAEPEKGDGK